MNAIRLFADTYTDTPMKPFYQLVLPGLLAVSAMSCVLLTACSKELSQELPEISTPYIRTSFEGTVLDISSKGVDSAIVSCAGISILSDSTGHFIFSQVLVDSTNASITAIKNGFQGDTIVMQSHAYTTQQVQLTITPAL